MKSEMSYIIISDDMKKKERGVKMKDPIGVVHGRFQLLHNDHVRYIMAGMERCEHLVIGICNPDVSATRFSEADPNRSSREANPFSYYERYRMIRGTLADMGVDLARFDIVPFPINVPEMIFNYVPADAKYYLTIYDGWGEEKKRTFERLGCEIEILRQVGIEEKGISGTDVRRRIARGEEWESLVPRYVYEYVLGEGLDGRIRGM